MNEALPVPLEKKVFNCKCRKRKGNPRSVLAASVGLGFYVYEHSQLLWDSRVAISPLNLRTRINTSKIGTTR